jgi:hypothetical protein
LFTTTSTVISTFSYSQYLTGYAFGGTGTYTSNSSSGSGTGSRSWRAFDGVIGSSGSRWVSDATYVANTPYGGTKKTTVAGVDYPGEWLQLQLPQAIVLSSYSIYPQNTNYPATWNVFASNDGSTWTVIDQRGTAPTLGQYNNYTISGSPAAYSYYRIGCYIVGLGTSFAIVEMKLYGSNASWNTDFYADRLGNLLTAPVTGQSLANWLGGATGYVRTWYDQSGRGNHATQGTAANQPIIQRATKGPGYMCVFSGAQRLALGSNAYINNTPYTLQIVERRNVDSVTSGAGYFGWGGGEANPTSNIAHLGYRAYSLSYPSSQQQIWTNQYSDDTALNNISFKFATAATENVAYTWHTHDLNHTARIYSYRGGTMYPSSFSTTVGTFANFLRPISINQYFLGWSSQGYYKGEIYELLVFTQSLYDLDTSGGLITKIYQNQLSYTGA